MSNDTERRVYVADLASYNNGVLHGAWIEATDDADAMQEQVNDMLRASRFPNVEVKCPDCDGSGRDLSIINPPAICDMCGGVGKVASAEEFAIHDYEGFPDGARPEEFTSLAELAEMVRLLDKHGDAWAAYVSHVGAQYATEEGFGDAYIGEQTARDYAEEYVNDCGLLDGMPSNLRGYFDYDAFARDLTLGGDVSEENMSDGRTFLFRSC